MVSMGFYVIYIGIVVHGIDSIDQYNMQCKGKQSQPSMLTTLMTNELLIGSAHLLTLTCTTNYGNRLVVITDFIFR